MPQEYISPYPKGEEFRRRAMQSNGRNTWKQPEPPPPPKPKQWFVLGMEVDYETYRKYSFDQPYTIDGDILKDIPCNLWTLEHYATEEHAKDYPIEAANARKLLDQIREEINTITGKDDKNMKTPRTAADFIDALKDIYNESRNTYAVLQDKVDKAAAKVEHIRDELRDPSCKEKQLAQLRLEVAQSEYKIVEAARRGEYTAMLTDHEKKVAELRAQFADHLNKHYAASPDKLDTATMQLLDSGICTPDELASLVERHQDCPTMIRIIGSYADKMIPNRDKMRQDEVYALQAVRGYAAAAKNGDREMEIFDTAVSTAAYGLDTDYAHATRMHNHVAGWMDDYKNQIANLPVTPADIAEESNNE